MIVAGIVVTRVMGLDAPRARLMAVGYLSGRGQRRQEGRPADHRHLFGREPEWHLQLVFDDLVMVKLEPAGDQVGLGHPGEQETLATRLNRDQEPGRRVGDGQPLTGAEIEERDRVDGRIKIVDHLLHAVFVRADVDRVGIPGTDAELP